MRFTDIVKVGNKHYYVDSCWTFDHGYETMVFACDGDGNVTSWRDLYVEWYSNEVGMSMGHTRIVNALKDGKLEV